MSRHRLAVAYDCLFPYTTGGGERQYESFARRLAAHGFGVDYLTALQWEPGNAPAAAYDVIPVTGRLRLYDGNGVRRTPAALAYAWGLFRALVRRRSEYQAVIVSGLPVLNVFAARAALVGSGTRVVVDYLEVWRRAQWVEYAGPVTGSIAWALQRLAIALTPLATCHSQLSAQRLRSEGLRNDPLISPGLIDEDAGHTLRVEASVPPYVLYAGRHIPDKRVETLPAAVAYARRTLPDLRLVITGRGPSTDRVSAAIAASDAHSWTDEPGFVSQDVLDDLMAGAAALVNPSRREGYGLVVVEASAHGTPVVLVDDEGNAATELVVPGVNGFVAATADADALGRAIIDAVQGGPTLRSSTRAWYEDALRTRTVERTVDAIVAAIGPAPLGRTDTAEPAAPHEGPQ